MKNTIFDIHKKKSHFIHSHKLSNCALWTVCFMSIIDYHSFKSTPDTWQTDPQTFTNLQQTLHLTHVDGRPFTGLPGLSQIPWTVTDTLDYHRYPGLSQISWTITDTLGCHRYPGLSQIPWTVTDTLDYHRYPGLSQIPSTIADTLDCHRYTGLSQIPYIRCVTNSPSSMHEQK